MAEKKRQTVLCVFAHPDDEAFGPGGTIAKLSRTHDVYTICVTDGNDPNELKNLRETRKQELLTSSKILGIQKVLFLGYEDGTLNNRVYHEIAKKISKRVTEVQASLLLTFELRGVSGHLDHVAVSMISSYVFERAKQLHELWYYCETNDIRNHIKNYFIYFPPGYAKQAIDKTVDVSDFWNTKLRAIRAHRSQKKDGDMIIKMLKKRSQKEHFLVWKK